MEYTNIYYFYYLSDIGGTETFLYELSKKYCEYDLTIIYRYANQNQLARLKKYVRCVQFRDGMEIKCKKAFFNYGTDIINSIKADEYIFVIHADYEDMQKRGQLQKLPDLSKINKFVAVSKRAAAGFQAVTGRAVEVSYNPFEIRKPNKVLNLISATRLSKEKGKNRMIKLAEALDKAKIKYIWTIFTNDTNSIDNPNIIYMKPQLDILDYIANADYLVQLSDNEGFCYSVVEALCAGTPVVVTPCPVFKELGLEDGKNCYIYPFDMENINVQKLVDKIPQFTYQPPQDSWDKLLIQKPSTYQEELNTIYEVEALPVYQEKRIKDNGLGRIPNEKERWKVSAERARVLLGENDKKIKYVKVVSILKKK